MSHVPVARSVPRALVSALAVLTFTVLTLPLGGCLSGEPERELVIHTDPALYQVTREAVDAYRDGFEDDLPYRITVVALVGGEGGAPETATPEPATREPVTREPTDGQSANGVEADASAKGAGRDADEGADEGDSEPGTHVATEEGEGTKSTHAAIPRADLVLPLHGYAIEALGERILRTHGVGELVPTIMVNDKWEKGLELFGYLTRPGARMAVGHKDKLEIGRVAESIILKSADPALFRQHIIYETDSLDRMVKLLDWGWADAAIVWTYVLKRPDTEKFTEIPLPEGLATPRPLRVVELRDAPMPEEAARLADYLASDASRAIFARHGFGVQPMVDPGADSAKEQAVSGVANAGREGRKAS